MYNIKCQTVVFDGKESNLTAHGTSKNVKYGLEMYQES